MRPTPRRHKGIISAPRARVSYHPPTITDFILLTLLPLDGWRRSSQLALDIAALSITEYVEEPLKSQDF